MTAQEWYQRGYYDQRNGFKLDIFTDAASREAYQMGYADSLAGKEARVLPRNDGAVEGAINATTIAVRAYHDGYFGRDLNLFIAEVRARTRIEVTESWIRDVWTLHGQGAADRSARQPDRYAGARGLWELGQPGLIGDAGKPPLMPPPGPPLQPLEDLPPLDPSIGYELYATVPILGNIIALRGVPLNIAEDWGGVGFHPTFYLLGDSPGDESRGFRLSGPGGAAMRMGQQTGKRPEDMGLPAWVAAPISDQGMFESLFGGGRGARGGRVVLLTAAQLRRYLTPNPDDQP